MNPKNKLFLERRLCSACRELISLTHLSDWEFNQLKECRCLENKLKGGLK